MKVIVGLLCISVEYATSWCLFYFNVLVHHHFLQDIPKHSMHTLVFRSLKRTHDMFISDQGSPLPANETA